MSWSWIQKLMLEDDELADRVLFHKEYCKKFYHDKDCITLVLLED